MRMRRSRRVNPTASIVLVMLVISVFAIGTGYVVSRFLISSFVKQPAENTPPGSATVLPGPANSNPSTTPATSTQPKDPNASVPATSPKVTPTVPTLSYGQVQLGAFAQEANAQNLVNSLKAQGVPSSIIQQGSLYHVVVGVFTDRNLADDFRKQMEAKGQKDVHFTSAAVSVTQAKSFQGNEGELVKSLATLLEDAVNITTKSLALTDQLYAKSGDQAAWRKQVTDLSSKVNGLEQIQLPNSQGSVMAQAWSKWVGEMKTHLRNEEARSLSDATAWQASQAEMLRAILNLKALYALLSAS